MNGSNGNDRERNACGRILTALQARSAATDPYTHVKMLPFIQFFHSQMMIGAEIYRILCCLHRAVQHNLIFYSIDGYVNARTKTMHQLTCEIKKKNKTSQYHGIV